MSHSCICSLPPRRALQLQALSVQHALLPPNVPRIDHCCFHHSSPVGGGLGGFAGFPVGVPGTSFFSNANANSAAKANNVQAADNHFNNHVDSNAGNQALQEDVVFVKNNANTVANDNGFQNAVSKNDAFNHNNAKQASNGAVFFGRRRQLGTDTECVGCGGVGIGGIPPSGFDNAKQAVNAANGANYFNQANQGRDTNAHQGFNNKRVEKHNLDQESFGDVNANSDAAANALSKGNLINKNEANAARGV
ncbi:unnamed protein product, partial [Aphanomyces euteiches]